MGHEIIYQEYDASCSSFPATCLEIPKKYECLPTLRPSIQWCLTVRSTLSDFQVEIPFNFLIEKKGLRKTK